MGAATASPVGLNDQFYVIRSLNILTAAKLSNGSVGWKKCLQGSGFWATPLLNDSHV